MDILLDMIVDVKQLLYYDYGRKAAIITKLMLDLSHSGKA